MSCERSSTLLLTILTSPSTLLALALMSSNLPKTDSLKLWNSDSILPSLSTTKVSLSLAACSLLLRSSELRLFPNLLSRASILAKTHRDDLMSQLALEFPGYGWETNVGYPTREHREGLKEFGSTEHHRKSFQLLPSQLSLFEEYL